MCGISGIFDLRARRPIDPARLRRMNEALVHRGPDGSGTHLEPGLGFAHQRLAIIDLAGGVQPMTNEDGRVITVFNGEIYNFAELQRDLERRGHRFRTRSDTEVIVHAFEEFGPDCVRRLRGMFAFALYDCDSGRLLLARDRLGEKPLYYTITGDGLLVFGSEVRAVLAGLDEVPALDPQAVADYFTFGYVPDPKSIFAGIFKLAPAHRLEAWREMADLPRQQRYWRPRFVAGEERDEAELAAELADRLREAVRMRMVADVPVGAFLSGGVDSSGIVAFMAGATPDPVRTCTIGFSEQDHDESAYADAVARRYRTRHSVQRADIDVCALLDGIAGIYGEPFADSSAVPTYLVCALARRQVKVALSGDGGDEVFAGYRRYVFHVREERVRALVPQSLRRPLLGSLAALYPKLDWAPRPLRARTTLEALAAGGTDAYLRAVALTTRGELRQLFSPAFQATLDGYEPRDVIARHAREADTEEPLSCAQYVDLQIWLPGRMLVKVDRASMACGLEVRPPLLDHELVEWAARLPPRLRLRGGEGKYLLKKALEPHVPHELLYRRKQGFTPPLTRWLRHELADRVTGLAAGSALAESGLFDERHLARLVAAHRKGLRNHAQILWALVMFDAFLRQAGRVPVRSIMATAAA